MSQTLPIVPASDTAIKTAADLIKSGELVGFPTETVYGLGGDATNDRAISRIFGVKHRPSFNPLIVHVSDLRMARSLGDIEGDALKLALEFWPGALTMVVPRAAGSKASYLVSAGLDTIAIRIPGHPVAQRLISEACLPIAAPSANISGTVSPTTARHVYESFGETLPVILDGGACQIGIESTVVLSHETGLSVLRPGGISRENIERFLGYSLNDNLSQSAKLVSPGQLDQHYAPSHPIRLNADDVDADEVLLAFGPKLSAKNLLTHNLSDTGNLGEAASNLFAMLRELDKIESKGIAVMAVPELDLGIAINDRLRRAAARPSEPQ